MTPPSALTLNLTRTGIPAAAEEGSGWSSKIKVVVAGGGLTVCSSLSSLGLNPALPTYLALIVRVPGSSGEY
jgi:hypothetical protein